jgi:AcrR family transcriptional regulator
MRSHRESTRQALLDAAGPLFAQKGFDGTSIRAIAEAAKANIAAVNYHFGSKENLYLEALRTAVLESEGKRPVAFLDSLERAESREDVAGIIRELVRVRFGALLSPERPLWQGQLIMRSMIEPNEALHAVARQIFVPDHEALIAIVKRAKPEWPEEKLDLMAYSLTAQIIFYVFARVPVLLLMGKEAYDEAFLESASEHVAEAALKELDLA